MALVGAQRPGLATCILQVGHACKCVETCNRTLISKTCTAYRTKESPHCYCNHICDQSCTRCKAEKKQCKGLGAGSHGTKRVCLPIAADDATCHYPYELPALTYRRTKVISDAATDEAISHFGAWCMEYKSVKGGKILRQSAWKRGRSPSRHELLSLSFQVTHAVHHHTFTLVPDPSSCRLGTDSCHEEAVTAGRMCNMSSVYSLCDTHPARPEGWVVSTTFLVLVRSISSSIRLRVVELRQKKYSTAITQVVSSQSIVADFTLNTLYIRPDGKVLTRVLPSVAAHLVSDSAYLSSWHSGIH